MQLKEINKEEKKQPLAEYNEKKSNMKILKTNCIALDELKKGDEGFAMLRCANWGYYIKKLYCIIGYKPVKHDNISNKSFTTWEVDVDLGHIKNVSKQHALIAYNFQLKTFEIQNLSKKFPIRVNEFQMNYNEEMLLSHRSVINIGNQEFYFLLPD